jgi:hypothetical protein
MIIVSSLLTPALIRGTTTLGPDTEGLAGPYVKPVPPNIIRCGILRTDESGTIDPSYRDISSRDLLPMTDVRMSSPTALMNRLTMHVVRKVSEPVISMMRSVKMPEMEMLHVGGTKVPLDTVVEPDMTVMPYDPVVGMVVKSHESAPW